ncbi:probable RNA-directed DNA polymerase from transposon X-element [Trichonephila clavipes]|nr:probable RNA-directed DNA polymerase from transposon X-element [Trichonephila clavipes]
MVTWNANGLRSRMWELRDFVNKYKPDVISLQETWLRPSHTIALANYRIYRNDRNHTTHNAYTARTGGGTAIMIKNSMKHTYIPTPNLNGVEATMVALTLELEANTQEDIDEQIAAFTDRLHQAYKNASKPLKHNDTFYISRDLNQLFKERNRARKIWHYTRSPADKNTLNRLQKQIKKIVLKHEQKQWDESLACLEAEDGSLWKAARDSRKKAPPIPALKGPTKIAYSDADKSEVIADSLQNQFKLNNISNDTDRAITHVVHTYLNNENNFTNIPPTPPPLPSEIIEHIDKVKINKAAGIDRITNRMLKHLPLVPIFELTNIIHNIIKIGYFPIVWKTATVVPILKPGKDPTQAESFRPIALLSILGKVAEKIILKRLYHHVEENNILIPEQRGFRPDLSTTHQLLRVVETIKSGFKNKKSTGAVFLDIQKAFDRVWREGLIFKLIKYDFPPPLIKLISSYLTDRNFSVRINDTYSSHRPTEAGVAQEH